MQTEKEMREATVPKHETPEALIAYIESLVNREHDYGTCVYAMSMAATAAFNYVASKLGVTGFQASCADLDILARTRGWKWGSLLNYENLLYPQYCDSEHFPCCKDLIEKNKDELAKRARVLMADSTDVHPNVLAHWKYLDSLSPEALAARAGKEE